ncbi:uncharacterized protein [Palaemon carinicauda]|uniref:uncharacterized protein n=1 Tax=Palaemon carinicauda TaxID=392227 RepID=UPI0035B61096
MEWDSQEADDLLANTTVDISEYMLGEEDSDGDDTPSTQPLLHYPHPNDSEEDGDRTDDDEDYENGVLSFENPNYTLGGSNDPRLDDALNSNNPTATHEGPLDGGLSALEPFRYRLVFLDPPKREKPDPCNPFPLEPDKAQPVPGRLITDCSGGQLYLADGFGERLSDDIACNALVAFPKYNSALRQKCFAFGGSSCIGYRSTHALTVY